MQLRFVNIKEASAGFHKTADFVDEALARIGSIFGALIQSDAGDLLLDVSGDLGSVGPDIGSGPNILGKIGRVRLDWRGEMQGERKENAKSE